MKTHIARLSLVVAALLLTGAFPVSADHVLKLRAKLAGSQEVPVVSTGASGEFEARLEDDGSVSYTLSYEGLEGGNVLFAHIHLAQPNVNGAVMTFLCGGGTKPAPCPAPGGTVEGVITAADIQAIATQQVPANGYDEFLRALRHGFGYVNVHTAASPGGEIRGQIVARGDRRD
jgi:hypothetical protein